LPTIPIVSPERRAPQIPRVGAILLGALLYLFALSLPLSGQLPDGVLPPTDLRSADALMRGWSIDQGLPQGTVTGLIIDAQGFVWGTTFGGLFRFDGHQVRSLRLDDLPELGTSRLTSLTVALDGGIWVGSEIGNVIRVQDGRGVEVLPRILPLSTPVRALHEDPEGGLWAQMGELVYRFDGVRWERRGVHSPPLTSNVFFQDPVFGVVLAGAVDAFGGGGEARYATRDTLLTFNGPDSGSAGSAALSFFRDEAGTLWVGTNRGLQYSRSDGGWGTVPGVSGPVLGLASCVISGLWALTADTIYRLDLPRAQRDAQGGYLDAAVDMIPLPYGGAKSLVVTRDGVIVVGFHETGFITITPKVVHTLTVPGVSPIRHPHSIVSDGSGGVWITSDGVDLIYLSPAALRNPGAGSPPPGSWREFGRAEGRSLALDSSGRVWVGRPNALFRYGLDGSLDSIPVASATMNRPFGLPEYERFPRAMVWMASDSLVAGYNDGGLLLLTDGGRSVERFRGWPEVEFNDISGLAVGPDGTLWVGGTGKVARRFQGEFRILTAEDGVPGGPVRALHPVRTGVWLGGYGGGVHFVSSAGGSTKIPLEDPTVSALIPDPDGSLWVFQNTGLVRLTAETVRRVEAGVPGPMDFRRFRSWDGVAEANNGSPAAALLPDGRLVLGTLGGVKIFDTTLLAPTATTPRSQLVSIETPTRRISYPQGVVRLTRDERALDLHFSLPTYRISDPIRTRYRLDGKGPWVDLGSRRVLQFASLSPGRHLIEVEARLPDGVWRPLPPVTLEVEGRLMEYAWFQQLLIGILLLLSLITAGHSLRFQRLRALRLQSRLELEIAERDRDSVHREELARVGRLALAGEMAAAMAHEVSQPVAAIVQDGAVARLLLSRSEVPIDRLRTVVEAMVQQGERARIVIQGLRRFLVDGEAPREEVAIAEVLRSVDSAVRSELRDHGVRLSIEIEPDIPPAFADRGMIQQVLVNLVTNGAEAMRDVPWGQRELRIRARRSGFGVRISVVDYGRGIPADDLPSVFQPFFTTRKEGMGIGLPVVRRIILAHQGTIRVRTRVGQGSIFSFTLPNRPLNPEGPIDERER